MIARIYGNGPVQCSAFETDSGASEFFIVASAQAHNSFPGSLDTLAATYAAALKSCGLNRETLVSARFHLSDMVAQKPVLLASGICRALNNGAVSIVQQPPLGGGSVTLFACHIKNPQGALRRRALIADDRQWRNGIAVAGDHYTMLWLMNLDGRRLSGVGDQAAEVFGALGNVLDGEGMSLLRNTIRTWVYVRDIDTNYAGMVAARREFFEEHGLTKDTRFIASTGIEGCGRVPETIVSLDSLSIGGLAPGQIERMEALDHLSPTIRYGVTFERGARVRFGDRSHLYLSGTASIDCEGNILHTDDVLRQTGRTLENITALLRPHTATLADMAYIIVYLRNPSDFETVRHSVEQLAPAQVPRMYLKGPVCRPAWLVEIEGMAIIPDTTAFPCFLF